MKMAESYLKGKKTLWEKEKLLVMSNFSFSHSVFKRLAISPFPTVFSKDLTADTKRQGLVWKRIKQNCFRIHQHFSLFEFLSSVLHQSQKHCGKKEKLLAYCLPTFLFPQQCFQKQSLLLKLVDFGGKGG